MKKLLVNLTWVTASIFTYLDGLTTQLAINKGATEANPLMAPIVNAGYLWPAIAAMIFAFYIIAKPLRQGQFVAYLWFAYLIITLVRITAVINNTTIAT